MTFILTILSSWSPLLFCNILWHFIISSWTILCPWLLCLHSFSYFWRWLFVCVCVCVLHFCQPLNIGLVSDHFYLFSLFILIARDRFHFYGRGGDLQSGIWRLIAFLCSRAPSPVIPSTGLFPSQDERAFILLNSRMTFQVQVFQLSLSSFSLAIGV